MLLDSTWAAWEASARNSLVYRPYRLTKFTDCSISEQDRHSVLFLSVAYILLLSVRGKLYARDNNRI